MNSEIEALRAKVRELEQDKHILEGKLLNLYEENKSVFVIAEKRIKQLEEPNMFWLKDYQDSSYESIEELIEWHFGDSSDDLDLTVFCARKCEALKVKAKYDADLAIYECEVVNEQ